MPSRRTFLAEFDGHELTSLNYSNSACSTLSKEYARRNDCVTGRANIWKHTVYVDAINSGKTYVKRYADWDQNTRWVSPRVYDNEMKIKSHEKEHCEPARIETRDGTCKLRICTNHEVKFAEFEFISRMAGK